MKKILIIRFSSIGDIVLTTPVVRCLKKQLGAELHYLTKKGYKGLLEANPYIDRIHTIEDKVSEKIAVLKEEAFDCIIDLHHNLRSLMVKRELKCPAYTFRKLNVRKWLFVNVKINLMPDLHIVDRYMKTVETLGVANDGEGLDYFIPPEAELDLTVLPKEQQKGYVAFVIGGQHEGKMLKEKRILSICKKLRQPVVLLGGPEDTVKGMRIAEAAGAQVYNAAGQFSLHQSASLIRQASAVISHDTGLMHIAAAFKKKIVSVWGGTVPAFGMYPYMPGARSKIVEAYHVLRPPSKLGRQKGLYKYIDFMAGIDDQAIVDAVNG